MNENIDKITPQINFPKYWDELYIKKNDTWNLNTPSPVFVHLIDHTNFLKKGKILILGCGKGFDAIYAAKKGFEVTGVDFSEEAIGFANLAVLNENFSAEFLCEDFFALDEKYNNYFDYIFEYVTFCSLLPEKVNSLIEKCSNLLNGNGKLITQLFPIDNREGGPPFSIDKIEFFNEAQKYFKLEFYSKKINSVKPRKGKEILLILKKKNDSD